MSPSANLPDSVIKLLKSTRFLHLATSLNDVPHVSLMNYTYYNKGEESFIIFTTPKDTTKYRNILANPNVSLLVHDWISAKSTESEQPQTNSGRRNSLFELLANMNKAEISSVSVMLTGKAEIVAPEDHERHAFYKSLHLNNSLIDEVQSKNYIADEKNALFVVKVSACQVTDTNDNIQQY